MDSSAAALFEGGPSFRFDGTSLHEVECTEAGVPTVLLQGTFSVRTAFFMDALFDGFFPLLDDQAGMNLIVEDTGSEVRMRYFFAGASDINCAPTSPALALGVWQDLWLTCTDFVCDVFSAGVLQCSGLDMGSISGPDATGRTDVGSGRSGRDEFADGLINQVMVRDSDLGGAPPPAPTPSPSPSPTLTPTQSPSAAPSLGPSPAPSLAPSKSPTPDTGAPIGSPSEELEQDSGSPAGRIVGALVGCAALVVGVVGLRRYLGRDDSHSPTRSKNPLKGERRTGGVGHDSALQDSGRWLSGAPFFTFVRPVSTEHGNLRAVSELDI